MIIRSVDDLDGSDRDIRGDGWRSRRLLRRDDGMQVSLHWTELPAGAELDLEYRHHLEANLCIAGEGEVENLATGEVHAVRPGVMYALDKHDHHRLRARTELQLVCVFTPALAGTERHDASGGYQPE
ncbi:MAG: ectoine synthase [Candidatus Dormibacteraeota bacterium]|nr:ectoine synthase [Candidatus Dormibacteraeota bacterium]